MSMKKAKKNILITGRPGVGKTTFIQKISEQFKDFQPIGFYTKEIREHGIRTGFELVSFSGNKGLLSHIHIKSPYKVGRYNVNLKVLEVFLDSLKVGDDSANLIIIDEIGKMESFSPSFRKLIREILDSKKLFIATISLKGSGLIAEIKRRDDIDLFMLREENRNVLHFDLLQKIHSFLKP
jgi:nucleoside-triphosphatase